MVFLDGGLHLLDILMRQLGTCDLFRDDRCLKNIEQFLVFFTLESLFELVKHLSLNQRFVDPLEVFGLQPEAF